MATVTLSPRAIECAFAEPDPNYNSSAPRKRVKREGLRYIPGGPGGGGHWIGAPERAATTPPLQKLPSDRTSAGNKRTVSRSHRSSLRERTHNIPPPTSARPRRHPAAASQSYTSAADAVAQNDGYKPREERGWEEFHPDLDLEAKLVAFSADDVDGISVSGQPSPTVSGQSLQPGTPNGRRAHAGSMTSTPRRRPGRPPGRRAQSGAMLSGLGIASPPVQRPAPLPSQNPRERLTLPKPSYRPVPSLDRFEQDKAVKQSNYVSGTLEKLGYQKNDRFFRQGEMIRFEELYKDDELETGTTARVEYDMDEQDLAWLDAYNIHRREQEKVDAINPPIFEVAMTQIEKEWHALEKRIPKSNPKPPQTHRPRSSSSAAVNGEAPAPGEEQDSKCAICDDGDCENTNAIVFCDGCDLAVHQECYGVPYIPEGQWLCRKCQQVGKATTTCIFCPNTEGAFKLTAESKWAHLLCSIWIPEVTIANTTFMEPISQVADVPVDRWRLNCYLCNQKMGACIQCGSRQCYQAFHVTCARRAKLYLKMKSSHGSAATLDASVLKAYCDKHVPTEWRDEHDVDTATIEAKAFYRREMKGRQWANSRQSALTIGSSQMPQSEEALEEIKNEDEAQQAAATPGQRKRRAEIQKRIWRLPSGAPIVPETVCKAVEQALLKFNPLPKRKEFVAEACKYWTLKREARRGAALLKRLQLQMESFSTAEIARRDFAALGASGGPKLERRIAFAKQLEEEMIRVQAICEDIMQREDVKLQEVESLQACIDTVYFPLMPLLRPILVRAKQLDEKSQLFKSGFEQMHVKLNQRLYTSVHAFSADLYSVIQSSVGMDTNQNLQEGLLSVPFKDLALASEQKEAAKVARRILKDIQKLLEQAFRSEADLAQKPYEQEIKAFQDLEKLLEAKSSAKLPSATEAGTDVDQSSFDVQSPRKKAPEPTSATETDGPMTNGIKHEQDPHPSIEAHEPHHAPSITLNDTSDTSTPLANGGILWCFERFHPQGLTIQDEKWAGEERALSAGLSELDDDAMDELGDGMDKDEEGEAYTPRGADGKFRKAPAGKASAKKKRRRGW